MLLHNNRITNLFPSHNLTAFVVLHPWRRLAVFKVSGFLGSLFMFSNFHQLNLPNRTRHIPRSGHVFLGFDSSGIGVLASYLTQKRNQTIYVEVWARMRLEIGPPWFSYGHHKCVVVDSLVEYIDPSNCVHSWVYVVQSLLNMWFYSVCSLILT
jgi:hypothetical protein